MAFYGRDATVNLFIIGSKQLGSEIFSVDKGQVTLNVDKDIMKRIWDCYYVPYVKGYFGAYGRFRSIDLKIGKSMPLRCRHPYLRAVRIMPYSRAPAWW